MTQRATFGAGCFWGVEDVFLHTNGVVETTVGYAGGSLADPSYEAVCRGDTGHAEVVEVVYDPEKVSYDELLELFWKVHDPTTLNRQGPDVGAQYRSAVFYHTSEQKDKAEASRDKLDGGGKYNSDIVTEITRAGPFYPAEDYHQEYFHKNGEHSCKI